MIESGAMAAPSWACWMKASSQDDRAEAEDALDADAAGAGASESILRRLDGLNISSSLFFAAGFTGAGGCGNADELSAI